ncbi:hypothetical protein CALVIDRAFT_568003 [Calocera viscosa TUFC12733]|uniref:Uncharacterized protein n=1 Tax=Calocera viscosa (strain TUFC12733) TaxID=1330018 RepID=A0A167HJ89_CALVF|nr:hypothetical protein CALVIDRAFT_568003 [Calocera viscosa TUFC12733]
MNAATLNADILALVLDEVSDALTLYPTKQLFELAHTLRRVNRYANHRLEAATRFLCIPSRKALIHLMMSGFYPPNSLQTFHFHIDPRCVPAYFNALTHSIQNGRSALKRLIVNLRQDTSQELKLGTPMYPLPGMIKDIAVIGRADRDPAASLIIHLLSDRWDQERTRLAFWGVPELVYPSPSDLESSPLDHYTRPRLLRTDANVVLFLDNSTLPSDSTYIMNNIARVDRLRLIFAEDVRKEQIWRMQKCLPEWILNRTIQLYPTPRSGQCSMDWFAERIQDGTIWTMEGAPLPAMDDEVLDDEVLDDEVLDNEVLDNEGDTERGTSSSEDPQIVG